MEVKRNTAWEHDLDKLMQNTEHDKELERALNYSLPLPEFVSRPVWPGCRHMATQQRSPGLVPLQQGWVWPHCCHGTGRQLCAVLRSPEGRPGDGRHDMEHPTMR